MGLPLHARAAALVAALSTTAAIVVTIAEIGHPPPDGAGMLAFLRAPEAPAPVRVMTARPQPPQDVSFAAEMPQP
jgi:hypothetical protein